MVRYVCRLENSDFKIDYVDILVHLTHVAAYNRCPNTELAEVAVALAPLPLYSPND